MSALKGPLSILGAHLKETAGFGIPSLEDFQLEVAKLGLLGKAFAPLDYARALEQCLEVRIAIEQFPDSSVALVKREVLEEGTLAEIFYAEDRGEALVLVRESLRYRPWPAYELALYHELSHLAAGHPIKLKFEAERGLSRKKPWSLPMGLTMARRPPLAYRDEKELKHFKRKVYEPEARRRAGWLLLAGTFPRVFEREGINRLA